MRLLILIIWGSMILLLTATSDFSSLIEGHPQMMFDWDTRPRFEQIIELPQSLTQGYTMQKLGHIACFYILANLTSSTSVKNFIWLLLFACFTEFLQLYTGRSGRLLDVGYDVIGIYLGLMVVNKPASLPEYFPDATHKKTL